MTLARLERHERERERILEEAARAIGADGFHGMSMRKLAGATGRSLANFYNYFPSKDAVLFALHARAFETLIATATERMTHGATPEERLLLFVSNHVAYVAAHRDVMRVLIHEASALGAGERREVRALKERYYRLAHDVVSLLARGLDTEHATYCLFGMLNWVYGWYEADRHGAPAALACTIHRIVVSGVTAAGDHPEALALLARAGDEGPLPSPIRLTEADGGAGGRAP